MLKAGVIGLGGHGFRHLSAIDQVAGIEVSAVCDMRLDVLEKAVETYPTAEPFSDWEEMLAQTKLDLLCVVTNGPSHAPIVITAAESGVPRILCEKPFATSVHDARLMIAVCEEMNVRLAVSHGRRWAKSFIELKQMIADGVIGDLCHFFAVCGGGLFACNGSHFLDVMGMLSGQKPTSVLGYDDQAGRENPRGKEFFDPGAIAHIQFDGGMRGTLDMNEDLGVPGLVEIVGSMGRIYINELANEWRIEARSADDKKEPIGQYWLPFEDVSFEPHPVDPIEILVEAIRQLITEDPVSCRGEHGLASLEILIATHISHKQGNAPVAIPFSNEHAAIDIPFT